MGVGSWHLHLRGKFFLFQQPLHYIFGGDCCIFSPLKLLTTIFVYDLFISIACKMKWKAYIQIIITTNKIQDEKDDRLGNKKKAILS